MKIINKTLHIVIIALILFASCKNKDNEVYNSNSINNIDSINPALKNIIANYINSVPIRYVLPYKLNTYNLHTLNKSSLNEIYNQYFNTQYYYIVRFFNINKQQYFSIWVQLHFPSTINTSEGITLTNENDMYYYKVNNKNIIIMSNSYVSNFFSINDTNTNRSELKYVRKFSDITNKKLGILLSDKSYPQKTYKIINSKIIENENILSEKYKSEKIIRILSDTISVDSETVLN